MKKKEQKTLGEKAYQLAFHYELRFGCFPQCVLTAVQETVGVVTDETIKANHGLSGGGGLIGAGACGVLTGGLLALSCKRGRDRDPFDKEKCIGNFNECRKNLDRPFPKHVRRRTRHRPRDAMGDRALVSATHLRERTADRERKPGLS